MKNTNPSDPNGSYGDVHEKRFRITLKYLQSVLSKGTVLELGGSGPFTELLRGAGFTPTNSSGDLRYCLHKGQYDAVMCCEVIEHIHDQETDTPTEWTGTGTTHLLREAFKATRKGGYFILTTPNADSLNVLNKVIHRQSPHVYRPHVREYTCHEIVTMVRSVGFEVLDLHTEEPWDNSMSPDWRRRISDLLRTTQGAAGLQNRGEDIFLLAKRPQ